MCLDLFGLTEICVWIYASIFNFFKTLTVSLLSLVLTKSVCCISVKQNL